MAERTYDSCRGMQSSHISVASAAGLCSFRYDETQPLVVIHSKCFDKIFVVKYYFNQELTNNNSAILTSSLHTFGSAQNG